MAHTVVARGASTTKLRVIAALGAGGIIMHGEAHDAVPMQFFGMAYSGVLTTGQEGEDMKISNDIKEYESAFPAVNSAEWGRMNVQRFSLIKKEVAKTITLQEQKLLDLLTEKMRRALGR